jgi:DNA-binding PucR family transcriptional regulator
VRRTLADPQVDAGDASRRLGYDLEGAHVGLVLVDLGGGDPDRAPLEAVARDIAASLTLLAPLIVRPDIATVWCWLPLADAAPLELLAPLGPTIAGHGRVARGLEGFRRSHREAAQAIRVALLTERREGTMTSFHHVELAAVCSGDRDRCQAFVSGRLGALAASDDATCRIRATLETFLMCDSNYRATAKRLGVHHNTVRYRLAQAGELLGHPPGEDRLELEVALHLARRLGASVLEEP